jgi:hypothetical protein
VPSVQPLKTTAPRSTLKALHGSASMQVVSSPWGAPSAWAGNAEPVSHPTKGCTPT